jgi:hypothetical protein
MALIKIAAEINPKSFAQRLKKNLKESSHLHGAMISTISEEVSIGFQKLKESGQVINFRIQAYPYPNRGVNSLKEASEKKDGYTFWYFKVIFVTSKNTIISETHIKAPKGLKWEPIHYGGNNYRYFKFKKVEQKTQLRYEVEFLVLKLPQSVLLEAYRISSAKCKCAKGDLRPVISGAWDWHLHFLCSCCGAKYLCHCFKKAFSKQQQLDENWRAEQPPETAKIYDVHGWPHSKDLEWRRDATYRKNICHLCTGKPSDLYYCSSMYGSEIKVKYGPYIMRNSVAKGISQREAENQIRESIGVAKIGEGWITETELYKTVCYIIGKKHKVLREASPAWLGRQRLDIFIPALNLAIEYHGQQHFKPIEHFGGKENFEKAVQRDKLKTQLCKKNGIRLIVFKYSDSLTTDAVKRRIISALRK